MLVSGEMRQRCIVAGGSGDSVFTREDLTHAKSGGQPSHNFYAYHPASNEDWHIVYTRYILYHGGRYHVSARPGDRLRLG